MILLDRVTKKYSKKSPAALDNISLHVEAKEFVLVIGPSGAGKSTLLRLLTREEKPTSGKIVVGGIDYDRLKNRDVPQLRRKIGVVFQSFELINQKTALQNVELPLILAGVALVERRAMAREALEHVGLGNRTGHRPFQLSGGEKQRVAVARALVTKPKLILADEPTGNLDSENGAQIMNLLSEEHQQNGTTICLVTHDLPHAEYAQRRIELLDGRVVAAVGETQ